MAATFSFQEPLPAEIAIFPLPGVLLLPGGRLPLNVFEPRYLRMTLDALGRGRMIGMVQTVHPETHPVPDGAQVYPVGCAGRIAAFAESDDGRLLITLAGVSRFRITAELALAEGGYRRVAADWQGFEADAQADGAIDGRERLMAAARAYLARAGVEADWKALNGVGDAHLVTVLAMACPLEPREKQALLEADGLKARGRLLTQLLEMGAREAGGPGATARH